MAERILPSAVGLAPPKSGREAPRVEKRSAPARSVERARPARPVERRPRRAPNATVTPPTYLHTHAPHRGGLLITPRILAVRLTYGRFRDAAFELPAGDAPVVISGPNGAGKTTILEGIARILCGFNRRAPDDRDLLAARSEGREACAGSLEIQGEDGVVWELERSFTDATVTLRRQEDGHTVFSGDGNPGSDNEDAREFRRRLKALLGLAELGAYRQTALIEQGELIRTRLDTDLVQVATGGEGRVDAARERIRKAHRDLTLRPLRTGDRAANRPRELERVEEEIGRLRSSLDRTRRLEAERARVSAELSRLDTEKAGLEERVGRLRRALAPLHARARLDAELRRLRSLEAELDAALADHRAREQAADRARDEWDAIAPEARFPDDFPETLSAVQARWEEAARLERRVAALSPPERGARAIATRIAATAGALVLGVAAAVAAIATGRPSLWAPAAVLLVAGAALWLRRGRALETQRRRAELERDLADLRNQIRDRLRSVPRAGDLTAESAARYREEFERQLRLRRQLDRAEQDLERSRAAVRKLLPDAPEDAGQLAGRLAEEIRNTQRAHAKVELQLDERATDIDLPADVEPDPIVVERALREAERQLESVNDERGRVQERLFQDASPSRSSTALRTEIERLERRLEELELRAEAYEEAWLLLDQAYDEFREGDQERLLGQVSRRLRDLTDGDLGPVEASQDLEDAVVAVFGRRVRLDSPGLSYGERIATRLALRLGATDFLARDGVRPPLIVDEPFEDLDPERARNVWALLTRIARERQVIVATQNRLVLGWLGVGAEIVLGADDGGVTTRARVPAIARADG